MKPHAYLQQVAAFHVAFQYRQPEPRHPDFTCAKTNALRPKLLNEELHELREAIDANDRLEMLDALCDIQYVLSGAVLAWGLRTMFDGTSAMIELRKIRDMNAHLAAMDGLVSQMEVAAEGNFGHQVLTGLSALQSRLATTVYHLGFSQCFDAAFAEVHRSNMSKLWSGEDLSKADASGIWTRTVGGWIVKRGDGKIVKSPSYSAAQLGQFV